VEEILLRKWDQKTVNDAYVVSGGSALGIDTGETAADKQTFNDIDDFNGWTEAGVRGPTMAALPEFDDFRRQATVAYVDSTNTVVAGPTDYKQIQVCSNYLGKPAICMTTLELNR